MRLKLVETLNIIDYSKLINLSEDLKLPNNINISDKKAQKEFKKIFPNTEQIDLEDIIRSGNVEQIRYIVNNTILTDPANSKYTDHSAAIIESILNYHSINPDINLFLRLLDYIDPKNIDGKTSFSLVEALLKNPLSKKFIDKHLQNSTSGLSQLLSENAAWIIALFSIIENRSNNYKDASGKKISMDALKDSKDTSKFKSLKEIKKVVDAYTTEDSENLITLTKWIKDNTEWETNSSKAWKLIVEKLYKEKKLDEKEYIDLIRFFNNLFSKDDSQKQIRERLFNQAIISPDLTSNKIEDLHEVIKAIQNYRKDNLDIETELDGDSNQLHSTIGTYIQEKYNVYQLKTILTKIYEEIKKQNKLNNNDLRWVRFRLLTQLINQNYSDLAKQLLDIKITDPDKISQLVVKFIQSRMPDPGSMKIRDALLLNGINSPEADGYNFLREKCLSKPIGERQKLLDRFEVAWRDHRKALLNAQINVSNGKFSWLKAIDNFIFNAGIQP